MFTLTQQRKHADKSGYTYVFTMIMLATLNQLHTYLVDTSPPQTGNNEDIYTHAGAYSGFFPGGGVRFNKILLYALARIK